jgi:hypothetical protein
MGGDEHVREGEESSKQIIVEDFFREVSKEYGFLLLVNI